MLVVVRMKVAGGVIMAQTRSSVAVRFTCLHVFLPGLQKEEGEDGGEEEEEEEEEEEGV